MVDKKMFLTSALAFFICIFSLTAGCGQQRDALNLPEEEARQLKRAGDTSDGADTAPSGKPASPAGEFKKFYIYADKGFFKNHYIPSGWMGDYGDLKFNDSWGYDPHSRRTSIRIVYSAHKKQGAGWSGIYWQDPANNWGSLKGGYDLTGAKKLTFYARGERGGEVITEFKMGGIHGEYSDSTSVSIGPIVLTTEWREYVIDLKNEDLSLIIGGFAFVISSMENPMGATFYLDDIAYE